jgi:hypothetical protein
MPAKGTANGKKGRKLDDVVDANAGVD